MISDMFRRTDDILPHDDQRHAPGQTTERVTEDQQGPTPGSPTRRLIDIYVYDHLPADYDMAEATGDVIDAFLSENWQKSEHDIEVPPEEQPIPQGSPFGRPAPSARPMRHRRRIMLMLLLGCVCLALLSVLVALWWVLPALAPSATITIVPVSRLVSTTRTLTIVTGPATSTTADQVAGRLLSQVTMSQQKTVATTGTAQQDAQAAPRHPHLLQCASRTTNDSGRSTRNRNRWGPGRDRSRRRDPCRNACHQWTDNSTGPRGYGWTRR